MPAFLKPLIVYVMVGKGKAWLVAVQLGLILLLVLLMTWTLSDDRNYHCNPEVFTKLKGNVHFDDVFIDLVPIFVITPTYARPVQKAELTRMVHTLLHVGNLHWIVVEDSAEKTELVGNLLSRSGLLFTHLNVPTPAEMKRNPAKGDKNWSKPRGVLQRNEGLRWLRSSQPISGVLYFADDDNTYDLELFVELRTIKIAGVWPVAFVGEILVEKPVVKNGRVSGWDVAYKPERPFAVDMAGFAVNVRLIMKYPEAGFGFNLPVGHQETHFLRGLQVSLADLEPKAWNCTKVLVWHTRTEAVNVIQEKKWNSKGKRSDEGIEI